MSTDTTGATEVSVRDRLLAAGISPDRTDAHLAAGRVRVDGEIVASGDVPAPPPARIVIVSN